MSEPSTSGQVSPVSMERSDDAHDLALHRDQPQRRELRVFCLVCKEEFHAVIVTALMCTVVFAVILFNFEPHQRECLTESSGRATNATLAEHRARFRSTVDAEKISQFAQTYSLEPHLAGSKRNNDLAEETRRHFLNYGFDDVRVQRLPVLLMNLTQRSLKRVDPDTGSILEALNLDERNVIHQLHWERALPPTNAFSGSGMVRGPLVWVNYGRQQDFDDIRHIDLTGTIAVARYRKIFRGDKVKLAAQRGAIGVVLVHDPADMARGEAFPLGPWANNETVQRGSISLTEGDALTPTWPSEFGGPKLDIRDTFNESIMGAGMALPTIPVQPIGYGNAQRLLQGIGGGVHALPPGWENTGFLTLFSNGIGPGPAMAELEVQRELVEYTITNVFGTLIGQEEPDRAVVFGAHRDAWTYGAADPISGHSIMLEVARSVGSLYTSPTVPRWRPRRTIQFCSWDAEEWSIIGSVEYVETNVELLRQRAVAYLNLDVAVKGNETMYVEGSPLLQHAAHAMGLEVELPNGSPLTSIMESFQPAGSGTDHVGFLQLAGVPILNSGIDFKDSAYEAVYHSNYDSFYWMSTFGDPGYAYHAIMAQWMGSVLLLLAESEVLPMMVEDYASNVAQWVNGYSSDPRNAFADFGFMHQSVDFFSQACQVHGRRRQEAMHSSTGGSGNALTVRSVNDLTMGVERVFLGRGEQESGQPWYLHVLFTPSAVDFYSAATMPIIADALRTENADKANFAIKRVAQFVRRAATFLNETLVTSPWYTHYNTEYL